LSLGLLWPGACAGLPDGNWPGGKLALEGAIRSSSGSIWKRTGSSSFRGSMTEPPFRNGEENTAHTVCASERRSSRLPLVTSGYPSPRATQGFAHVALVVAVPVECVFRTLVVAVAVGRLVARVVRVVLARVVVAGIAGGGGSDPLLQWLDLEATLLLFFARFARFHDASCCDCDDEKPTCLFLARS